MDKMHSSMSYIDSPEFYSYLGGGFTSDDNLARGATPSLDEPSSLDDCLKKLNKLIDTEIRREDNAGEMTSSPHLNKEAVTTEFAQVVDGISASDTSADFAKTLRAASPRTKDNQETKESRPAIYKRKALYDILRQLSLDAYVPQQGGVRASLENLVMIIGGEKPDAIKEDDFLNVMEWSYVSLMLDQIAKDWQSELDNEIKELSESYNNNTHILKISANIQKQNVTWWQSCIGAFFETADPDEELQPVIVLDAQARLNKLSKKSENNKFSQFSLQVLKDIQDISHLQSAYLAQMHVIPEIADTERPTWTLGYSSTTTVSAFLGAASPWSTIGPSIGANATYAHDNMKYMDDEGNKCKIRQHSAGISVEGKFSFFGLAEGNASVSGQMVVSGEYAEFITPETDATVDFDLHIREREHRNNPRIAPYLSRTRLLCTNEYIQQATSPELERQLRSIEKDDKDEIVSLDKLKTQFDLNKEKMQRRILLYMAKKIDRTPYIETERILSTGGPTLDKTILAFFRETDVAPDKATSVYAPSAINTPDRSFGVIPASISCTLGKASVGASAGLGDGLGTLRVGKKPGDDIFSAGASLSGQVRDRTLTVNKRTAICERYSDPFKIGRKIKVDDDSWWPFEDRDVEIKDENLYIKEQIETLFDSFKHDFAETESLNITFSSTDSDAQKMKCFETLKLVYDEYKRRHADVAYGKLKNSKGDDISELLRKIEKSCGADTPEQLLHRLVIANAYLFVNLFNDRTPAVVDPQLLKDRMKAFEKELLAPPFVVDKSYLKEHCYFIEDIDFRGVETKFEFDVNASLALLAEGDFKMKLKGSYRHQGHTGLLRRGEYIDLAFVIGGSIGNVKAVVKSMAGTFLENMPPEAAEYALAEVETALNIIGPIASASLERAYILRIARPEKFCEDSEKFSFSRYFKRVTTDELVELGFSAAIPTGFFDITAGAKYSNNSVTPKSEHMYPTTFHYFIELYLNGKNRFEIDRKTGALVPTSNWIKLRERQEETLKALFIKYAKESKRARSIGELHKELAEYKKAIERNEVLRNPSVLMTFRNPIPSTTQELVARHKPIAEEFSEAEAIFATKTTAYHQALNESSDDANNNYVEARTAFENLLHAIHPLWFESRANSPLLRARKLAGVELNRPQA
jgi:hypothetical protein